VDFTERSGALVEFASRLDPVARLELFHAIDAQGEAYLKAAEVSEKAITAYRASRFLGAQENIVRLKQAFGSGRNRVQTALRRGDAGRQIVIQQESTRADLVVVGADRATAVIPLLAAGVAHRVLAWGRSDVLVIPRSHAPAARRVPVAHVTLASARQDASRFADVADSRQSP
jgi:nucleotide-binding universal stress UspA family protein